MEQDNIKQEIDRMTKEITSFSIYMPQYNLKGVDEIEKVKQNIRAALSEKLKENIEPMNNTFALENFDYCTKELGNQ